MRSIHRLSLSGLLLVLLMGLSLLHGWYPINHNDADRNHCAGIYMYPSYLKLIGLDSSHSRLSSKYHLYLYREQAQSNNNRGLNDLNGIPVLFIPGNAGSYKQGRSIAAESFYNSNENVSFDFYTAHFNEDFTAFHGRTLLDQAEYLNDAIKFILSLYSEEHNEVVPKSVIIIAHSMGGMVSRVMLTLPNYLENSINTIITLATPHAAAPATFDGDIMNVYSSTDKFWRSAYFDNDDTLSNQRLKDLSLISITGGWLDQVLPADYTTLQGLIPKSNGFTVYTSTIPQVWTPMDHLAIVWCDQLRKKISESLFDIAEIKSPLKTKSLDKRMEVFKNAYLSGFEEFHNSVYNDIIELDIHKKQFIERNPSGVYHKARVNGTFSLLSEKPKDIYACNGQVSKSRAIESYKCLKIPLNVIPNSKTADLSLRSSSVSGSIEPFYGISLDPSIMNNYQTIIFEKDEDSNSLVNYSQKNYFSIDSSLFKLLLGIKVKVPRGFLTTDYSIENAWSSLLVYNLKSTTLNSLNAEFSPFIRQYINEPFESKWHLQLHKPKQITIHGVAPYTPFKSKNNSNLHLEIWKPLNEEIILDLKINIFASLKLLILRYRLIIASFPIVIITATLFIQFRAFFQTSIFPDFEESLNYLCQKTPQILIGLSLFSVISSNPIVKFILHILDPYSTNNPLKIPNSTLNPYFLGLEEKFLWTLVPFFYIISITLVCIIYHVIQIIMKLSFITKKYLQSGKKSNLINTSTTINELQSQKRILGTIILAIFVNFHIPYQFAVIICTITQLLITIKSSFKYQTSIQSNSKQSSIITEKQTVSPSIQNFHNYCVSILLLMLWLIPINVPILIVFFHNMVIRWKTPFTSHHNVLAILPIILLISSHVRYEENFLESISNNAKTSVKLNNKGDNFETFKIKKFVTLIILGWFCWFSLVYGIRASFYLHYLFNLLCAWLIISKFWNS